MSKFSFVTALFLCPLQSVRQPALSWKPYFISFSKTSKQIRLRLRIDTSLSVYLLYQMAVFLRTIACIGYF
ncbi:hypothetical protein HMPREF1988_01006 [Porphyromonas gingivalis F0185]|nr:hypothetical protein HMPREF1988_01006 [Porphyromonas gingivalis F0185]